MKENVILWIMIIFKPIEFLKYQTWLLNNAVKNEGGMFEPRLLELVKL